MADVVVTIPRRFGFDTWLAEGDPAGSPPTGREYFFTLAGPIPEIEPGDRVYVVYNGAVRGYAPLVRIHYRGRVFDLVRAGGAVAVTIRDRVEGFRGWRYRWWDRSKEIPFINWRDPIARPPRADL